MPITRCHAILATVGVPTLLSSLSSREAHGQDALPAIESGPFDGSLEALKAYQIPEWFKDAKFGVWAHWGPQSAAEDGDWYARNIYIQDSPQYKAYASYCTSCEPWKTFSGKRRRLVSLTPWAWRGGLGPGSSYNQSSRSFTG